VLTSARRPLDVLVVSRPGDLHGDAVEAELRRRTPAVARLSLNTWRHIPIAWTPDEGLVLQQGGTFWGVNHATSVWWRRPGWIDSDDLEDDEAELARAEGLALLYGALESSNPRWVDHPIATARADNKLQQLATARAVGARTPLSLVTNSIEESHHIFGARPFVGKAVSSGQGLAPFVDEVRHEDMHTIRAAPVLLQDVVPATADLRLVCVGEAVFAWQRDRHPGQSLDWRHADPEGRDFYSVRIGPDLIATALAVSQSLDVTMSAQDWLLTTEGPVFLEVNPQGQWLFLVDAAATVVPAVANHLLGSTR
jgi:hypothetical protein